MSETESFESVAKSYDNYTWIGRDGVKRAIDRLKAAHKREIRDTAQQQYSRGFNDGQHSMDAEHRAVAMRLRHLPLDGGSHENLSQIARAVYHSDWGWTQGACAALRDELVRLMGGVSDGTAEPMTTDEFIEYVEEDTRRLKGDATRAGDGDDTCGAGCCCAAADCDGGNHGEHAEVSDGRTGAIGVTEPVGCNDERGDDCDGGDSGESEVGDGRVADDSSGDSRGSYRGMPIHLDGLISYNVLDNERQKAVCELRRIVDDGMPISILELACTIGTKLHEGDKVSISLCNRLIHLLGGDQPSGIDVLREMDAESDEDETYPNDVRTLSITDELREFVGTFSKRLSINVAEVNAIADRIDAQFDRICQQHEAVLQSTIDEVVEERDHWKQVADINAKMLLKISGENASLKADCEKLEELRDRWCQQATELMNCADAMERERDNLLDLLGDGRDEYMNAQALCDELRCQREELMRKWMHERAERKELQDRLECACGEIESTQHERDELRAKLDKANGENKGLRLSIEEQKESIAQRKKTIGKLTRDNEKVWKTVHELRAELDEYDRTHIELPRDANGEVFRVGCEVKPVKRETELVYTVYGMTYGKDGWKIYVSGDRHAIEREPSFFEVCEKPQDTAESIVRDLSIGAVTEAEAIERIEALNG